MNVNVGVMGHVDSGKTSLVGALSTCLSTCALDKHPQSKQRGITLDLGFSSFRLPLSKLAEGAADGEEVQFTLVDCPGHASLIRTIIGATQIIDVFLLVVDVTKGIQTQTAECLVLAQVSPCTTMLVVLNKIDMLQEGKERDQKVAKVTKVIHRVLEGTKFAGCKVVAAAVRPGGAGKANGNKESSGGGGESLGLESIVDTLVSALPRAVLEAAGAMATAAGGKEEAAVAAMAAATKAHADAPLIYAVDHCFAIKGQGTVLTGTVLQGSMRANQMLHIPRLRVDRKVKSMQVFKRQVQSASRGERVAICVTQLDPKSIERDYLCESGEPGGPTGGGSTSDNGAGGSAAGRTRGVIGTFDRCVASTSRISFFKENIESGCKIHVTLGYVTVLAQVFFFSKEQGEAGGPGTPVGAFNFSADYCHLPELQATASGDGEVKESSPDVFVVMIFDKPVTCPTNTAYIASRLDLDVHTKQCRLAFFGTIVDVPAHDPFDPLAKGLAHEYLKGIRVYKTKRKTGKLERIEKGSETTCIASGFFKKDSDISKFVGLNVYPTGGEDGGSKSPVGTLVSSFGKSGKVKVEFDSSIAHLLNAELELCFKKYTWA